MKRRIIKQGHNTLTITLPSNWAKKFNIKAGEEINLSEENNGLFISTEKRDGARKTEIDISGLDVPLIWKFFMAAYREGYDEITVKFNPNEVYGHAYKYFDSHTLDQKYKKIQHGRTPLETIQEITNRFIGFEIIEHHKNYCIIKDLSEITSKEFDSSLRRVFLLILQMGEEMLEAIKENNPRVVAHTHDIDINVDKFHDYCIRVLNKTLNKETRKSNLYFATLFTLELIGDEFKNIARHLMEDMKGRKLNNLLQLGEMAVEQLNKYYDLFYNFTKEKTNAISKQDIEIYFYYPKLYKKKPNKKSDLSDEELEIFNHFRRITRHVNTLTELRIEMEF